MFGFTTRKQLRRTIAIQDNSIKLLKDTCHSMGNTLNLETIKVIRLAAENSTLKSKVNSLEAEFKKGQTPIEIFKVETGPFSFKPEVKKTVHPNLQAYYDRKKLIKREPTKKKSKNK